MKSRATILQHPGSSGPNWGEAYVKSELAYVGEGPKCTITARDDKDPKHKQYSVQCTSTEEACQAIYCYANATPPPKGTMVTTTERKSYDLTKRDDTHLTEIYRDENAASKIEMEKCSN